jgi:lipoyl-dependent peroxiredoxin
VTKVIYTAEAHVHGGRREGHGRSSDGELEVDLRAPGSGGGTNPEQLFAVGYAACFESALRSLARGRRVQVGDVSVESRVDLVASEDGQYDLAVGFDLTLPDLGDDELAAELVRAAHAACPYSRATRGNIDVALSVSGKPVSLSED